MKIVDIKGTWISIPRSDGARMGRFGSPYAALSFTAVDSALAEFDSRATPLEQFIELEAQPS